MLLPENILPQNSIYFNGAYVLEALQDNNRQDLFELYQNVNAKKEMTFPVLILCLDWLYLINVAEVNPRGEVELCF